ncbi:MAG: DUF2189 domain-containing protein [Burkholderiales bacterium]|nr:MAG: DUF2189 domain-containing protein [Burkholderiales bacterium]
MQDADHSSTGLALPPVRAVPPRRVLHWLAMGWRDFVRVPLASGLHGMIVAAGGMLILLLGLRYWYLIPGAISGFVLVGPILATGLYELSRHLERGEQPGLDVAIAAWRRGTRPLVWLGLVSALAGTLWVLLSAILLALFVTAPITGLNSLLRHVVLSEGSNLFPIWMALGGFGAALLFAVTVVSAPLMLDRDIDFISAVWASVRAVSESPVTMALWALVIAAATGLAMVTAMVGFVVMIPVIGHATWHAYRDVVDASALPPRADH